MFIMEIDTMDTMGDDSGNGPRDLLSVPQEIRFEIYRSLFSGQSLTVTANMKFDWPKVTARQNLCLVSNARNVSTAILLTCRQIYHEARAVLYQCVDYVCVERTTHAQAFNRFGYEHFDFARSQVRRLWGLPLQSIYGHWAQLVLEKLPQLEVVGLNFETVVPVVKIKQPGASFPDMSHERLLKAVDVLGRRRSLEPSLKDIAMRRPAVRIFCTFNFIVGHVDEDRQLHIMMLVELIHTKIVKTLWRHDDCPFKITGEGGYGRCHRRIDWPEVLDMLDGKDVDVGSFPK